MGNAFAQAVEKSAKKTAAKPKKGNAPVIKLDDEHTVKLNRVIELKKKSKETYAKLKAVETELIEHVREMQDTNALGGDYHNTYELLSKSGETVKFITSEKWSVPKDEDDLEELRELLGDDADEVLKDDTKVVLKPEVFEDEALQERLMELLGDEFQTFFDTTTTVVPNGRIAEKIYKAASGDVDKLKAIRALLPQAKPAIK